MHIVNLHLHCQTEERFVVFIHCFILWFANTLFREDKQQILLFCTCTVKQNRGSLHFSTVLSSGLLTLCSGRTSYSFCNWASALSDTRGSLHFVHCFLLWFADPLFREDQLYILLAYICTVRCKRVMRCSTEIPSLHMYFPISRLLCHKTSQLPFTFRPMLGAPHSWKLAWIF